MVAVEFVVFVASSGLFFSERFRHNLWAVITAGVIATASSLLFLWHLGDMMAGRQPTPPVQIIKQVVEKPVPAPDTDPAIIGKPRDCKELYPFWSRLIGDTGTTKLAFKVVGDGTVAEAKVLESSGSERLDRAAVECVSAWHYKPAIRQGQIADVEWQAAVRWGEEAPDGADDKSKPAAGDGGEDAAAPKP
jgi:TonB family protein